MSTFLYFKPGVDKPVSLEDAKSWGLGYAFDAGPQFSPITGRTPTGGPGQLFCDGKRAGDQRFAYLEEQQTWRQIPGSDVWVGLDKGHKPGPNDLMRPEVLAGQGIKLNDGGEWLIPLLWFHAAEEGFEVALPLVADLDESGAWSANGVSVEHDHLKKCADRLHEGMVLSLLEEKHEPLDTIEMLDMAATLLKANYVISKIEVAMLGLLTNDDLLVRIGRIAMDMDRAEEWVLKKTPESPSSEDDG